MATLDTGRIVVIALASVLVFLIVAVFVIALVLMKKRSLLCFKRKTNVRPILLSDRELEARYGPRKQRRRNKNRAKSKASRKKSRGRYQSLGRTSMFPKSDPFANKYLENPLVDDDEFNVDWSNPAFDEEGSRLYDAAVMIQSWYRMIRVRTYFVQLREATILAQAHYKGLILRRNLPQLRREKQLRDQQRKKQTGWKKKGTLSALKFYEVKGYGFAEVEQLYGLEMTRNAAEQLKKLYGGKGQMRLKLFISIKGIKLFDYHTMRHFATVNVSSVSFCTLDPKNKKLFAFINRKKKRKFCHVFQANEQDAQKMVETMAEAFEVTFKRNEKKQEERELARLSEVKKQAFHRQSQELDVEVASMMEMAETASITTPSLKRSSLSEASTISDVSNSSAGSRERLIAGQRPQSSGLLVSQKAPKRRVRAKEEEESADTFDPSKVDDYFTDIQEGVVNIANTIEREGRRATNEAKQKTNNSLRSARPASSVI